MLHRREDRLYSDSLPKYGTYGIYGRSVWYAVYGKNNFDGKDTEREIVSDISICHGYSPLTIQPTIWA
jgi:hypothetical protein